jgi:hypothetical protein
MAWIRKQVRISRNLSVLILFAWSLCTPPPAEATITYVYDRLGRLAGAGTATQLGVYSPQVGGSYNYSWKWTTTRVRW